MSEYLVEMAYIVPAALLAIILHEFAHALMSTIFGDPTPKEDGRLSLNPVNHIDPIGALCLVFFHFGWAKPVQVNPEYYKDRRSGMFYVAFAGPLANMILGFLSMIGLAAIFKATNGDMGKIADAMYNFCYYFAIINIGLGVFNLIPIPPLDGSKMLGAFLKEETYFKLLAYEQYGILLLIVLLSFNTLLGPITKIQVGIYNFYLDVVCKIFNI